ncbi:MAG: DUF3604 domain-containing protein [Symploca sp. SIO2C1]|nr:DUF3604 domain-containing protein [Symploca sp. SIO2C1]
MFDKMKFLKKWTAIALSSILLSVSLGPPPARAVEAPPQRDAYFGDLHIHTSYSLDAYLMLSANTPDDAYRFAKGEKLPVLNGEPDQTNQLSEELDFAAITDHSEFIGEVEMALNPDNPCYNHPLAKAIRNDPKSETLSLLAYINLVLGTTFSEELPERTKYGSTTCAADARKSAWKKLQDATENNYEDGVFTTLHAFEWSSAPSAANLHRNVFFKDTNLPEEPFSIFDSQAPEDLWDILSGYEQNLGTTVLAIPHNSNVSANRMFAPKTFDGEDIDPAWAELRAKYEPLVEIIQTKGGSETTPRYAPDDEFADFELFPEGEGNLGSYGYLREALKNGLRHEASLGTNPFKYGIIAATDNHNGSPGDTEEFDFIGSHGFSDNTPALRLTNIPPGWEPFPYFTPGGLTGVWAEKNNRESIFDALQRKEAFGTSGTRTKVRFFGGWDFPENLDEQPDAIDTAYLTGVPMGGDLIGEDIINAPTDKAPKFLVMAMRDPQEKGVDLDRIQVVKGWTKQGLTYEKIYDVVWAGDRQKDPETGELPPIENTVNVDVEVGKVTFDPNSGKDELMTVWEDPDFDPTARSFYYLRALEIPAPRYSAYDYVRASVTDEDRATFDEFGVPLSIQERAWSSPIWYTPSQEQLEQGEADALTVSDPSLVPLTEAETLKLFASNRVKITNLNTGEVVDNIYGPLDIDQTGRWLPIGSTEAQYVATHIGEKLLNAPKYAITGNQLSFNIEDGSEFVAELFDRNGQILAARDDEVGYVNYQVDVLIDVFSEPCCPEEPSTENASKGEVCVKPQA